MHYQNVNQEEILTTISQCYKETSDVVIHVFICSNVTWWSWSWFSWRVSVVSNTKEEREDELGSKTTITHHTETHTSRLSDTSTFEFERREHEEEHFEYDDDENQEEKFKYSDDDDDDDDDHVIGSTA